MKVEIFGSGCPKCIKLEAMVKEVVINHGIKAKVIHVDDIDGIVEYGVMITPALVVDGKVKIAGRLPSESELLKLFK